MTTVGLLAATVGVASSIAHVFLVLADKFDRVAAIRSSCFLEDTAIICSYGCHCGSEALLVKAIDTREDSFLVSLVQGDESVDGARNDLV